MAMPRVATALMGGFSLLALLLASVGIYAVVAFTVERRTHELGIRAALGATRAALVRMVVRESLVAVWVGLVAGFVLAAFATRGLEAVLFGVRPTDGVTIAAAMALLLAMACIAAFVPARRAAAASPVEALRSR